MARLGFGEAISFSPFVSFTLMHVYMNTEIKLRDSFEKMSYDVDDSLEKV